MAKKIVVISHDYDGCFDILTKVGRGALLRQSSRWSEDWERYVCTKYAEYLRKIVSEADEVRMYVGSARQSFFTDQYNARLNQNGSAFEWISKFCVANNTSNKPYIFEPLLMSDPLDPTQGYLGRRRGESLKRMHDFPDAAQYDEIYPGHHRRGSKVHMLLTQMWDAYRQNPGAQLEFYFVDDLESNIIDVLKNIKPNQIPPNMNFLVTKFDYTAMRNGITGALSSRGKITGLEPKSHQTLTTPLLDQPRTRAPGFFDRLFNCFTSSDSADTPREESSRSNLFDPINTCDMDHSPIVLEHSYLYL